MFTLLTIRQKAVFLLVGITVGVSAICLHSTLSLRRIVVIDRTLGLMEEMNFKILECRRQEKNFQLRGVATHGADTENSLDKWKDHLSAIQALLGRALESVPQHQEPLSQARTEMDAYEKAFLQLTSLYGTPEYAAATPAVETVLVARARTSQQLIKEVRTLEVARKEALMTRSNLVNLAGGLFVIASVVLLGFVLVKKLVEPVETLSGALEEIASKGGNLTTRLPVTTEDEIGTLALWFNRFVENIHAIIFEVSRETDALVLASDRLDHVSGALTRSAANTADRAGGVSASGLQMSGTMKTIFSASEEATANLARVAAATEEMEATIDHIAVTSQKARITTEQAVAMADSASTRIRDLSASAAAINAVAETITEISSQTNLLALNATIEAARAGSAGKGFAVVATEIKALSAQTAEATQTIHATLSTMQKSTRTTADEIEKITEIIHGIDATMSDMAAAMAQQSTTTKDVAGRLTRTSGRMGDIHGSLAEGTLAATEISGDISEIDAASREIVTNASDVGRDAEALSDIANRLKTGVSRFVI